MNDDGVTRCNQSTPPDETNFRTAMWLNNALSSLAALMAGHPAAAFVVVFLVAAGEAVFILGLFVPSTAVLLGAGALVGSGQLPFLCVFILTTAGAIAGDALSFWFGRRYRSRLIQIWPFVKYPALIRRGEGFFARYGASSVFLGRFVPGIKSVIPGIAGMMGLSRGRFYLVNVSSAIAWAAAHIFPGMAIGLGLKGQDFANWRVLVLTALLLVATWIVYKLASIFVRRVIFRDPSASKTLER
ncbi:DedA family protein [Rhizobium sp. BK376]|uniref:DedA family protein n=1 Tax=Rhizobium sp. BK376 TaxID=2512149 RepID=UPI001045BB54|nr:DedA family protein [Rhizobium sp. BK376]TCR85303.1 membrane protein DedA with SNARE-associated domain [Rhizobium sp. BK376]